MMMTTHATNRSRLLATAVIFAFAGALSGAFTPAYALDLYVSPQGDDTRNGRQASMSSSGDGGPFATLERARDEIRAVKQSGALKDESVTVHLASGVFVLERPFELTEEDSGTMDAPVVYRAEKLGGTRVLGGPVITGFQPVTDPAALERLDESARGMVVSVNLPSLGITDFGPANGGGLELFFNQQPMQISRWPNEGFVKISKVLDDDPFVIHGQHGDRTGRWVYDGDRPIRWQDEKDAWLYGYWFWDWSAEHQKIKNIDTENRIIELEKPYHHYGFRKGQWYYAMNLLSEIDMPGEWYLDRESGDLFFWPPASLDDAEVFVSVQPAAVKMSEVSNCTVRGIVFEGFRSTVVQIKGGTMNQLAACTIRNSGADAVSISGGTRSGVLGCDIYEIGGTGINLNGGDRKTLTPSEHYAINNHIHDYSRWYRMYRPGISLRGVGQRASHNLIHDAPHMAIFFGGNDHLIDHNEIHSVCYESNDAGAIYSGRDWTMRGTVIRYNFMHNVLGYENRGCVGVYLDDMFCGTNIYGNLFYRVYRAAFIGGGRDNTYTNNLFVDCPKALHIDNRAQNWAASMVDTTMTDRYHAMPVTESPWKDRYPELLTILEDDPAAPKGNRIARNIFYGEDWDDVYDKARPYIEFDHNLENVNPNLATPDAFRNTSLPKATDFALKTDSPAFATGFEALPLEKMGLYNDEADEVRATWPVVHRVRPRKP
jgi:hypothetical protein